MNPINPASSGFAELGIASRMLKALKRNQILTPTPIQHQSIPIALEGKDILGIAQTGTGKTLAYAIPMLQRLDRFPGTCLILVPTRELASQVEATMTLYERVFNLRSTVLIGGTPLGPQIRALKQKPRIVIATPGRLIDLLEQNKLSLDQVKCLILDEADRMLDMGFAPQLKKILKLVPNKRQTLLFSATMSQQVLNLATSMMELPVRIEIAPAGTSAKKIEQEIFIIRREAKFSLLERLLAELSGRILVFVRTKRSASKVTKTLKLLGHKPAEIHSDRSQGQRRSALAGFKSGRHSILIATDIAARGIDVDDVTAVINFDLPDNSEDYVHRIGRTGRAGKRGKAISFATPEQRREVRNIERLIRKKIKVSENPKETTDKKKQHQDSRVTEDKILTRKGGKSRRRRGKRPSHPGQATSHKRGTSNQRGKAQPKKGKPSSRNRQYPRADKNVPQDKSLRQKNRP